MPKQPNISRFFKPGERKSTNAIKATGTSQKRDARNFYRNRLLHNKQLQANTNRNSSHGEMSDHHSQENISDPARTSAELNDCAVPTGNYVAENNSSGTTNAQISCTSVTCQSKVHQLENELKLQREKYHNFKQQYGELIKVLAKKDLKIAALEKNSQLNSSECTGEVDLSDYKNYFQSDQLKELENINKEKRGDSTFVKKIISALYGECNISKIPSLRPRTENHELMPVETQNIIKNMLSQRLDTITAEPSEYLARLSKTTKHISNALYLLFKS